MKKCLIQPLALAGALFAVLSAAPAYAQTRTWVSGTGNDADPCSFTAPCKTLAGAYSKTAAGGEISVMNSGAYGQVTISKAITINGEGALASVLASSGTGITVAAGANDRVIIRNLSIVGAGTGSSGITVNSGNVTIDKCLIYGFQTGFIGGMGILASVSTGTVHIDVRDTAITNSSHGVLASTSGSGAVVMSMDNVRINDTPGDGIGAISSNVFMSVRNSLVTFAGSGIVASGTGSTVNLEHSELTHNVTAVSATASGATVRLGDVSMYENNTGLAISGGGIIATAGNNRMANSPGAATNGTVTNF